ncbi:MAG: ABC transporter ATP-binding protein [Bacilli bacterium]|nr:ABC transporter ATP-binding protein [Bacilli bacterium]
MEKDKKHLYKDFIKNAKITLKYSKNYKGTLLTILIINLIVSGIGFVTPILSAKYISYLTKGLFNNLLYIIIVQTITYITSMILRLISDKINRYYDFKIKRKLQLELTRATLTIDQNILNKENSGTFIERINGATNLSSKLLYIAERLFNLVGDLGVLLVVLNINLPIGITYIIIILINVLYDKYRDNINYKNSEKVYELSDKTSGFISEIVRGIKDIKILNAEESFLEQADKYMNDTNTERLNANNTDEKLSTISSLIREISNMLINLLMVYELIKGNLSIESALIIYNYKGNINSLKYDLSSINFWISDFVLCSNRTYGILDDNKFPKEKFGNKNISKFKGHIEFKDVNFSYEENIPVLKNLNLEVLPNEVVGFVGPSGAGKSTIFNLISALNKPDSGEILFDGESINELTKDSIRGNLSVISQNAYIFNMSIEDNLRIIKKNATKKEIEKACKMACLDEFIESLPNKYKTIVGEGGVTLSGGQRQRIAIARALLLNTEVLLFDEATSSLDNTTQEKIQKAIENLKGKYTILIIAHRLSTVINSDKIYVINKGTVEGVGTHKELLKTCKIYADLYKNEDNKSK